MEKNINEIQQMSTELYKRLINFLDKFSALGSNISKLNKDLKYLGLQKKN